MYRPQTPYPAALLAFVACLAAAAHPARADEEYEADPIRYSASRATDPVARLQERLDAGEVALERDEDTGYLPSLMKLLGIPASSQTLVFSKTSLQRERISPRTPRALYFNDDVYVGYVRDGSVLELAAADPNLGTTFYTLYQGGSGDASRLARPKLVRQTDNCLQCHAGPMTRDIPGLMLRSVFPDVGGRPVLSAGTLLVTHETPFAKRWGGWYVTGTHGQQQRHLGNAVLRGSDDPDDLDTAAGANVTDLANRFDPAGYLTPHSDLVALMVMEHQAHAHNLLNRASYQARTALRDERVMNEALGRPADFRSDSTTSRVRSACEPLVKYLLFSGEAPLAEPVAGTSTFAADYAAAGPRDAKGRSLRDLDLKTRLLRYPCSPLIYSASFDALPEVAKAYVYRRMLEVLSGQDQSKEFAHLSADDRRAILEILRETKPELRADRKQ